MNRRLFVKRLSHVAAGLTLYNSAALAAGRKLSRIGTQLYTVRRELEKDFEGTLTKVAALGYKEVEFAGYFGRRPAEVQSILKRLRLDAPAAHVSFSELRGDLRAAIDAAHVIGHKYLLLAWTPPEERRTLEQYRRLADLCNEAGARTKREGIQFAYHNHDFEFAREGDGTVLDLLLTKTDPSLVDFEMDLYWVTKAGADPLDLIARYPKRFPLMHAKDASAGERGIVDVGKGTIDFAKIFQQERTSGMTHVYVENDIPGDAVQSATFSYQTLANLKY